MKKERGFVLVETIVVITIMSATLLSILTNFNSILVNEKRRMYYDDPAYLYRTNYILEMMMDNSIVDYLDEKLDDNISGNKNLLITVGCHNTEVFNPELEDGEFCQKIVSNGSLDVEGIYFTYMDTNALTECKGDNCELHDNLKGLSRNMVNYLKSLSVVDESIKDDYMIVIEYKKTNEIQDTYYYSSLLVSGRSSETDNGDAEDVKPDPTDPDLDPKPLPEAV